MNIQISSEHIELFDHHKDYVNTKLDSLRKFSDILKMKEEAVMVKVMIESKRIKDEDHHILIRVNMSVPHAMIRGEAAGKTIEEVTDLVFEKLKRQIERYKEKHMHDMHDAMPAQMPLMGMTEEEVEGENSEMHKITRRKLFADLIPMSEQEAISQMLVLGHTFFIFVNERTNRYNMVYKRDDGYGLVELEQREGVI